MRSLANRLCWLILPLALACNDLESVNVRLRDAQLEAVAASPYKSAQGASGWVEKQATARATLYPAMLRDRLRNYLSHNDTLWLLESFAEPCFFCPASDVRLLCRDTIYELKHNGGGYKTSDFTLRTEPFHPVSNDFDYRLYNDGLLEVAGIVRSGGNWRARPLQFGSDGCMDGSHELFSILYPDGRIEALYVRCWMPRMYRKP